MLGRDHRRDQHRDRPDARPEDRPAEQPHGGDRLDRVRDAAAIHRHAELSRQKENDHQTWGHAFVEHVDVSEAQLAERVRSGATARDQKGITVPGNDKDRRIPRNATRWQSESASVEATAKLWTQPQTQQRRQEIEAKSAAGEPVQPSITARGRLSQLLGPDWRGDVYGRSAPGGHQVTQWNSDDAHAVAVFRRQANGRWYLHTCYPDPNPLPKPGP